MKIQIGLSWVSLVTRGCLDIDTTHLDKDYILTGTGGITKQLMLSPKAFYAALKIEVQEIPNL